MLPPAAPALRIPYPSPTHVLLPPSLLRFRLLLLRQLRALLLVALEVLLLAVPVAVPRGVAPGGSAHNIPHYRVTVRKMVTAPMQNDLAFGWSFPLSRALSSLLAPAFCTPAPALIVHPRKRCSPSHTLRLPVPCRRTTRRCAWWGKPFKRTARYRAVSSSARLLRAGIAYR